MQTADLPQHAVDAIPHAQKTRLRLEVNVGGAALDGVVQKGVDEANNRIGGRVAAFQRVRLPHFDLAQNAVNRELQAVVFVDRAVDFGFLGDTKLQIDLAAQKGANLIEQHDVVGVGDGERDDIALGIEKQRKHIVAFGHIHRHFFQHLRRHRDSLQIDALRPARLGENIPQSRLGQKAHPNQNPAERVLRIRLMLEQGDAKLILAQHAFFDKALAERGGFLFILPLLLFRNFSHLCSCSFRECLASRFNWTARALARARR